MRLSVAFLFPISYSRYDEGSATAKDEQERER
jgi:hypothetical protein